MKLLQLQYLGEIARRDLNISYAAKALHTSQSGISRQIALLERELKLQIFERNGKRLTGLTPAGQQIVERASRVLEEVANIKKTGEEFSEHDRGSLVVATTHTQARYFLPTIVKRFSEDWPGVKLTIHQGNPVQVAQQVEQGQADIGIATEAISQSAALVCLPCYQWNRSVVLPSRHPLLRSRRLSLRQLAAHPLITYDFGVAGGSAVLESFRQAGLTPNIVLTAIDADVIKTYVKLGLGVGLVATMAYDRKRDSGLQLRDASHLFPPSTTYVGLRRQAFLRGYLLDFVAALVPGLSRRDLQQRLASA
ncbi:MAG: CysB family HTH-type transcriptional regulator [Pseudohongiellaceae bacterium]|jgi:LysR family transcriptional regulator, cys regulon transcriptional activator